MSGDPESFVDFAGRLADAARAETLTRWRGAGEARNKAGEGRYDPVTEADVAAEQAMRSLIERHYPTHGIVGEETAARASQSRWCWSLDPIDGTGAFICGLPTWVTLIGLLCEDEPVLGIIDVPRLSERYVGHGSSARLFDAEGAHPLHTSGCTQLGDARLTATTPAMFKDADQDKFARVRDHVRTHRFGYDGYGYARLAAGSIDLVIESGLQPYDYNAVIPLIRAAGGITGNWQGGSDMGAGQIVAAASQALFDETIVLLNKAAD
jgi:myo-inositol-1(or 4)-monophosphatase